MTAAGALRLRECPIFPPFQRASLAFAFQLHIGAPKAASPRCAFRVSHIHDAVIGARPGLSPAQRRRAQQLFEPSQSFLDDITTGVPGTNGRPLLLAAEARGEDDPPRLITLERRESWGYQFEGTDVALQVDPGRRRVAFAMHEHFCIFESGRMFYLLVLGNLPDAASQLDEYSIIQAQQLAIRPELAHNPDFLTLEQDGQSLTIVDFVRGRLAALDRPAPADQSSAATAIGDVLRPFGIIPHGHAIAAPDPADLCNAMVQIEDELLFDTGRHAYFHYRMPDGGTHDAAGSGAPRRHPGRMTLAELEWATDNLPLPGHACDTHHIRGFGGEDEELPIPRQLLAFAGMAQGVPDFPRQDDSEIHDSTRPVSIAPENLFYVHPAFELAVGKNWRTLRDAQDSIGACPYALLTWLIAVHDELIVADMERLIEEMIFGALPHDAEPARIGQTTPLRNLSRVLDKAAALLPPRDKILDINLEQRINIFRWCTIHQSGNVFRYPTERELLASIREARGTRQRFDDAHQLLDRYENLAEDVSTLQQTYASAHTNWMLAAITLFSLIELPEHVQNLSGLGDSGSIWATLGIIAATLVLFLLWRNTTQLRRSRKS